METTSELNAKHYEDKEHLKFVKDLDAVLSETRELLVKKNQDYGNATCYGRAVGTLIRLQDKLSRLCHLSKNGSSENFKVNFEGIEETVIDIIGYSALLLIYLKENKKS